MEITKLSRNIARIDYPHIGKQTRKIKFALLSDLHFDNPKCERELLKKHLDYCLENNIGVMLNGDTFCIMQSKTDFRHNKSDLLSVHKTERYIDSVVEEAVDWFSPYASIIKLINYGNHETAILKHKETDIIKRFVTLMNYENKTNIITGGYGGWLILRVHTSSTNAKSINIKYHHGIGNGAVVTRGAISLTRALEHYENMDVFTMGHIHETMERRDLRDTLKIKKNGAVVEQKEIFHVITGTYKDEYKDGAFGFHIEKGRYPRAVGGRILEVCVKVDSSKGMQHSINSYSFPI